MRVRARVRVRVHLTLATASVKLMQSRSTSPSLTLLCYLTCSSIPRTLYSLGVVWVPLFHVFFIYIST